MWGDRKMNEIEINGEIYIKKNSLIEEPKISEYVAEAAGEEADDE
jgi:hypothetical protein